MDLDAIKTKLESLQNQSTTSNNFWKPEPGTQVVRIVPYKHNKDNPFIELFFHYQLGNNKTYMSPVSFGRPDPVSEFADKLKSTGDKDEWIQGKRLEPKMRTFAPVVVRGRESEGVKFWGFGKTVYTELLGFITDPDYGDITDPVNGRDIGVEFIPSETTGGFPKTVIRVKPNTTAVTEDKAIAEKISKEQPDLSNIFKEPSYDDLKVALEQWLNPESDGDSNVPTEQTKEAEAPTGVNKVEDVSSAFDALFNE